MPNRGLVRTVDYVSAKQGEPAWRIITDAQNPNARGGNDCAIWVPHDGPRPAIGQLVEWSAHLAWWGDVKVHKIDLAFDPNDPALYTG